jgi:hypothetical protein
MLRVKVEENNKTSCVLYASSVSVTVFDVIEYKRSEASVLSRDGSVGIATGYRLYGSGSVPGGARFLFFFHRVQTNPSAHSVSCRMGTGDFFPRVVKRQGRVADHSPPSSVEANTSGAIPPLPHILLTFHNSLRPVTRRGQVFNP